MSRGNQTKKEMRKSLDDMLEKVGLGADFMSAKDKRNFIKYVQEMGETIPPKEFHIRERTETKFAFSKDWKNVEMKLVDMHPNWQDMFADCRTLTEEELREAGVCLKIGKL